MRREGRKEELKWLIEVLKLKSQMQLLESINFSLNSQLSSDTVIHDVIAKLKVKQRNKANKETSNNDLN